MKKSSTTTTRCLLMAISIASLVLTGCNATMPSSTPPVTAGCKTFATQEGMPNIAGVSVLSSDLAKMIGVQDYFVNRSAMGLASANTSIYNCTEQDVLVLFRARFAGERGETEKPSAWRQMFVPPRGTVSYGEMAINPMTSRISIDIADGNRGQSQVTPGQTYTVPQESIKQGVPQ